MCAAPNIQPQGDASVFQYLVLELLFGATIIWHTDMLIHASGYLLGGLCGCHQMLCQGSQGHLQISIRAESAMACPKSSPQAYKVTRGICHM